MCMENEALSSYKPDLFHLASGYILSSIFSSL